MNTGTEIPSVEDPNTYNRDREGHPAAQNSGCLMASRQSGKDALRSIILNLRQKAASLEVLVNMTPTSPTHDQDQALWDLANNLR